MVDADSHFEPGTVLRDDCGSPLNPHSNPAVCPVGIPIAEMEKLRHREDT